MDPKSFLIVKTDIKKNEKNTEDVNSPTIYSPASVVDNVDNILKSVTPPNIYWKKSKLKSTSSE